MRIWEARIKNTKEHSFRRGQYAMILDVVMVKPSPEMEASPCFEVRYSDGQIGWVAVEDAENYEISKNIQPPAQKVFTVDEIVRKLGEE